MTKKKILICVYLVLFSAFAAVVSAANIWEENNYSTEVSLSRNIYEENLGNYKNSRKTFLEKLNKYKASECTDCDSEIKSIINSTKEYLTKITDTMVSFLSLKESKFKNSKGSDTKEFADLQKDIDFLKAKKEEILKAEKEEAIESLAVELGIFWQAQDLKIKKYDGLLFILKIEAISKKLEEINNKLDQKIETAQKITNLKEDTEKLKKDYINVSQSSLSDLLKWNETLKNQVEEIINDIKELIKKKNSNVTEKPSVKFEGIQVKGDGLVNVIGNINISGKLKSGEFKGSVTITDNGNDFKIDSYNKGERVNLGSNKIRYDNLELFTLSGSNLGIDFESGFLEIEITGEGSASIKGNGLYKLNNNQWTQIPKAGIALDI